MSAYYNEIDPFAAQWLRNLIAAGPNTVREVHEAARGHFGDPSIPCPPIAKPRTNSGEKR